MRYNTPMLRSRYIFIVFILLLRACAAPTPAPSPTSPAPLLTPSPRPLALHNPDPETLLRVLNYGIGLERDAWSKFDYPTFHGDFLTSPEARALFDFVQADFDRYYPEGIPGAGAMFTDGALDPNIWFPPRAVWLLAQTAIVERLRAEGLPLTDSVTIALEPFTLLPTLHELDGDPTPEWLVEVTSEAYNLRGWIPLDETPDGYTLIPNDIRHENLARGQSTTFEFTPDLNGDGLDDLVFHFDGQALGTQFGELKVYGRVDGRIVLLVKPELGPGETFNFGDYNGDGVLELHISTPRTFNFGCEWVQITTYDWMGDDFSKSFITDRYPPDTPLCNAAKFLEGGHLIMLDKEQSFETVVQAISADIVPSEDYLALLQIRLAMDYAGNLEDEKAKAILDQLTTFQNSSFATLASQIWMESAHTPLSFCIGLVEAYKAGEMEKTDLATYLTTTALFQAYGNEFESAAPLICAPNEVLFSRLFAEKIPTTEIPVQYLLDKNYPLLGETSFNLDDDPEDEWIAGFDIHSPKLLIFDVGPANWTITSPYSFSDPIQALMLRVDDLPENNAPDLFLLVTFASSVPVSKFAQCWEKGASIVSELEVFYFIELVPILKNTSLLCDTPPDLNALTLTEILALLPEPAPYSVSPDEPSTFLFTLEQAESNILQKEGIAFNRKVLQDLRALVPPDHPTAPHLIPRLLFDLGLSYELEGDAVAARAAYLELITQWPDSPWAWLAKARLGQ